MHDDGTQDLIKIVRFDMILKQKKNNFRIKAGLCEKPVFLLTHHMKLCNVMSCPIRCCGVRFRAKKQYKNENTLKGGMNSRKIMLNSR